MKNYKRIELLPHPSAPLSLAQREASANAYSAKREIKRINYSYKEAIKGFIGPGNTPTLNSNTLLHYNSKSVVYSFNKVNNLYPLLTKTEYLLKSLFRSMFSLISKPVYLLKHDKIIIRLFVFLSPKYDKYLDTCTRDLRDRIFRPIVRDSKQGKGGSVMALREAQILRKIKNLRPKTVEILLGQMHKRKYLNQINLYEVIKRVTDVDWNKSALIHPLSLASPSLACLPKGGGGSQATRATPAIGGKQVQGRDTSASAIHDILCESRFPSYPSAGGSTASFTLNELKTEGKEGSLAQVCGGPLSNPGIAATTPSGFVSHFKTKLERLSIIFEKIFNKKVEFEIIKAQLPFQDSNILAQILGYNANKYKFRRMLKILIPRAVIKNPSIASYSSASTTFRPIGPDLNGASASRGFSVAQTLAQPQKTESWLISTPPLSKETEGTPSLGAKNLKMLLSQPSSYLPPFFYSIASRNNFSLPLWLYRKCLTTSHNLKRTANPQIVKRNSKSSNVVLPSYLSGMNVKLAGRLMTQSIRPRFTVQSFQEGSLARVKVHYIEKSRFTGKNKRGAFSFTVTISHVFN